MAEAAPAGQSATSGRRSLAALALLLPGLVAGAVACGRDDPAQRIVLISLDTLRHDSFAGSPNRPGSMPYLEQWAERSTVFERFFAATGSTQPSHASMFTGLHPWQHGVTRNRQVLGEHYPTIAERLRVAGFSTTAVVASLPVSRRFGFGRGFDDFDDEFLAGRPPPRMVARGAPDETFYSLAGSVTERALARLDAASSRQQFFWFHYFDPHSPYGDTSDETPLRPRDVLLLAQAGKDTKEVVERARHLYDVDVLFLDTALRPLLERLDSDAAAFETHVLITADHGESFGEDGSLAHGRRLIPSQLHVPCLIRSPALAPGERQEVAGSVDIAATILTLAGLRDAAADEGPLAARSLLRAASGSRALGMRRTSEGPFRDLRLDGKVHLLDGRLFYMVDAAGELYRGNRERVTAATGAELVDETARQIRRLFAELEEQLEENPAASEADPGTEAGLQALGYLD